MNPAAAAAVVFTNWRREIGLIAMVSPDRSSGLYRLVGSLP